MVEEGLDYIDDADLKLAMTRNDQAGWSTWDKGQQRRSGARTGIEVEDWAGENLAATLPVVALRHKASQTDG